MAGEKNGGMNANSKFNTPVNKGTSKLPQISTPNSIYEQLNPDGTVKSRAFYDDNGNGLPNGKSDSPLIPGYNNNQN